MLKAIRLPVRQAKGVIRISLGTENTLEDIAKYSGLSLAQVKKLQMEQASV